jgi:hypothetical protein
MTAVAGPPDVTADQLVTDGTLEECVDPSWLTSTGSNNELWTDQLSPCIGQGGSARAKPTVVQPTGQWLHLVFYPCLSRSAIAHLAQPTHTLHLCTLYCMYSLPSHWTAVQ